MPSIFLSYRRADTCGNAGRLTDSLERYFGKGNVFQDLEAIVPGTVDKNCVNFFLGTVYGAPHRYEGTLTLSSDAQAMSGVVRESNSNTDTALALTRPH